MIDLRADYHGHVIDFVCDQDRRWLAEHPKGASFMRAAYPHEFCIPFGEGDCVRLSGHVLVAIWSAGRTREPRGRFLPAGATR